MSTNSSGWGDSPNPAWSIAQVISAPTKADTQGGKTTCASGQGNPSAAAGWESPASQSA